MASTSDEKFGDVFANPDTRLLTSTPTAVDANGVERIVGPPLGNFTPAPTEATDEEKAAAKDREKMYEDAAKARQELLKGSDDKPAESHAKAETKSN